MVILGVGTTQFPAGFPAGTGQLPGNFSNTNFSTFRPQYSVPGQQAASSQATPPQTQASQQATFVAGMTTQTVFFNIFFLYILNQP